MTGLTLSLHHAPPARIDAANLLDPLPSDCDELARRILRSEGGDRLEVGELFAIGDGPSDEIHLEGELSHVDGLGTEFAGTSLTIHGDVGHRCGAEMRAGRIMVNGDARDWTGCQMSGGELLVQGSVGRGAGAARPGERRGMSGGEIVIFGDAGDETGAMLRRGVIAVAGSVGGRTLHAALAGTVLALGEVGPDPARLNKRASLIAFGQITPPTTYVRACRSRPLFLRVMLLHLRRRYEFPITDDDLEHSWERLCGDFGDLGRGEILRLPESAR